MVPGSTRETGTGKSYALLLSSALISRQPSAPQTARTPYVPLPGVIEQNESFEFALSAAPNVLYQRYKQYGQVCNLVLQLLLRQLT